LALQRLQLITWLDIFCHASQSQFLFVHQSDLSTSKYFAKVFDQLLLLLIKLVYVKIKS